MDTREYIRSLELALKIMAEKLSPTQSETLVENAIAQAQDELQDSAVRVHTLVKIAWR